MDIYFWRYELRPRVALGPRATGSPRQGALLRVGDGYADLHPWPELGDLALDSQLKRLGEERPTSQAEASLQLAARDRKARENGLSLFAGREIPPSHYLWTDLTAKLDLTAARPFQIVKLKSGKEFQPVLDLLPTLQREKLKVRVDFNAALDPSSLERFLSAADTAAIDFLEDPMPAGAAWKKVSETFGVRFAADLVEQKDAAVAIHKPALRALSIPKERRIVVTSYLDHPVGQMHAAAVAAELALRSPDRLERCGLLSHHLFEKNEFSERIRSDGPVLMPPDGSGVGFDDLLERLPWKKLT